MPLVWKPPKRFMSWRRIRIYHTYRHENANDQYAYHYTTDVNEGEECEFDIRHLPVPPGNYSASWSEDHKYIIRAAIEKKLLTLPDDVEYCHGSN